MDPRLIGPDQWIVMTQAMNSLVLFLVLAINMAACMLIAHAVIPSLILTGDVPLDFNRFRPILYSLFAVSLVAAVFAFARALMLAGALIEQVYPRFVI
jgi:hypothetical protein